MFVSVCQCTCMDLKERVSNHECLPACQCMYKAILFSKSVNAHITACVSDILPSLYQVEAKEVDCQTPAEVLHPANCAGPPCKRFYLGRGLSPRLQFECEINIFICM